MSAAVPLAAPLRNWLWRRRAAAAAAALATLPAGLHCQLACLLLAVYLASTLFATVMDIFPWTFLHSVFFVPVVLFIYIPVPAAPGSMTSDFKKLID